MKMRIWVVFTIVAGLLVMSIFSGCNAGVSKEARLTMFKADVIDGDSPKEHFGSRSAAVGVNYGTITTIGLDNTSGNTTVFTGQSISGNSFALDFNYTPLGGGTSSETVTGTFYSEENGLSGEDCQHRNQIAVFHRNGIAGSGLKGSQRLPFSSGPSSGMNLLAG
jgi:hypothetical protein